MMLLNPEYVSLIYDVNHLRDMIAEKLVEKDYLINYVCRDYKVDYMLKIGSIEYKKMIVENDINKIKRKIDLIEELETFNEDEIDDMISNEFHEKSLIQMDLFSDINTAINYSMEDNLTQTELDNLNMTYCMIVRSWNPTINISLPSRKLKLYKEAEQAYKDGNSRLLENYVKLIEDDEIVEQGEIQELKSTKHRYKILIQELDSVIRIIKNSFPFNERQMLEDEELLKKRKEELNNQIRELEEELKNQKAKLEKLIKEKRD